MIFNPLCKLYLNAWALRFEKINPNDKRLLMLRLAAAGHDCQLKEVSAILALAKGFLDRDLDQYNVAKAKRILLNISDHYRIQKIGPYIGISRLPD